jgi:hypothetical protein
MNNNVLPFRPRKVTGTQKREMPADPRFCCVRCDQDVFRIYADMRIFCVTCCSPVRLTQGKL